jgi:hypothetical protein
VVVEAPSLKPPMLQSPLRETMDETSLRSRGKHWLMSHVLFDVLKLIFVSAFLGLISLGIKGMTHATLETAFNIFLVLIGLIGVLWLLGVVHLPTFSKKEEQEPQWDVFFYSPGLAVSLAPGLGRVTINLQFLSTKATELIYLHVVLRNNKGANLSLENPEPIAVAAMQVNMVTIDRKFPLQELATFEKGEMVNLDGYGKFREHGSMKQFGISMSTIPSM